MIRVRKESTRSPERKALHKNVYCTTETFISEYSCPLFLHVGDQRAAGQPHLTVFILFIAGDNG